MRRSVCSCGLALFLGWVLLAMFPVPALADGGAPNLAYVAGAGSGISIIDIGQKKVTGTFALAGHPQSVYLSLDGRFLYIAQPALNQISVLAAKTGQLVCQAHVAGAPSFQSYDPQTNSLFVAGTQATSISDLNLSTCAILSTWQTRAPVQGMVVVNLASDTTDNQLWVSNGSGVSVFDVKTGKQLTTVSLPGTPRYLSAPPGAWVYVSTQQGSLYAMSLTSDRVLPLLSGGQFGTMDFDETTGEVYVPDRLHHQLDVITPPDSLATKAPAEPIHTYALSGTPVSVAITSDGQLGFVALTTGQVVMLDILGHQVLQTIHVGGDPQYIITGLYPPVLGSTPQQASILDSLATIIAYLLVAACMVVPIWYIVRKNHKNKE